MIDDKSCFNSCDSNYLMEQQLVVMMNTIPKKDGRNSANFF